MTEPSAQKPEASVRAAGFDCPVCGSGETVKLTLSWKKYHDEKQFLWSEKEWFSQCRVCGTLFRAPLLTYEDFKKYGRDYYDQVNQGQSVEEHAVWHFENFQKPNYDAIHRYLLSSVPPEKALHWLDVGSVGYATAFKDYHFQTIEPDPRIVKLGRRLFGKKWAFFQKPKIHCATLETYFPKETFDGILFNNSFYCLTTPLESLHKAYKLLRPDGYLVISISTYFNDAVAVRTDGMVSRIEDALPGETLWVFYNRYSLEFLCAKVGFELESVSEVPCYGKKTMRVYRFRKVSGFREPEEVLALSRENMTQKLESCFDDFGRQTADSLRQVNHPDYLIVTTSRLLTEILSCNPLERAAGIVLFDSESLTSPLPSGCLTKEGGIKKVKECGASYKIAILSFKYQDEIYAWIRGAAGTDAEILIPNRKSGMEQLFFEFNGQTRPCKGISLHRAET